MQELQEVKINLPLGTSLIVALIFIVKILLITTEKHQVYKHMTLPIQYTNDTIVLVAPEVDYLGLNNNNDIFFILTENQWEACKKLKDYKHCKGSQPVHQISKSELCKISLLSIKEISKSCKIEFLLLEHYIYSIVYQIQTYGYSI